MADELGAVAQRVAVERLGTREVLPTEELFSLLQQAASAAHILPSTDLISSLIQAHTTPLTLSQCTAILTSFLVTAKDRQDRLTPAVPVIKSERRKAQRTRSQQITPHRSTRQHPPPPFPVSLSVFYQGSPHPNWNDDKQSNACQVHSERSNLAQYNLVLRRFPELRRSFKPEKNTRNISLPAKFDALTGCRTSQQRTLVDSEPLKAFIPANPAEAKSHLIRPIHGFQGTPYEAKRLEDLAAYKQSKAHRVAKDFKPAYNSELLRDGALYLNSQLTPAAFLGSRKVTPKKVSNSQAFYP